MSSQTHNPPASKLTGGCSNKGNDFLHFQWHTGYQTSTHPKTFFYWKRKQSSPASFHREKILGPKQSTELTFLFPSLWPLFWSSVATSSQSVLTTLIIFKGCCLGMCACEWGRRKMNSEVFWVRINGFNVDYWLCTCFQQTICYKIESTWERII